MKYTQESLYQLTPQEFEVLCSQVITKILPSFENIKLNNMTYREVEVDISGTINGEVALVEVKHRLKLSKQQIKHIFDRLKNSQHNPKHIILMTSALLSDIDLSQPIGYVGISCHYIGATDILKVLNESSHEIPQLKQATKRSIHEKITLIVSSLAMALSVSLLSYSFFGISHDANRAPLEKRITTVENALSSLKGLESQLLDIKEDMIEKQKATEFINQEYKKAEELKKLTDTQLEAVKNALQFQSAKDNFWSFIFGVFSSLVASVIYQKYERRQELKSK